MTWVLVWAGLLIVVLYSPIGSPDFYSSAGNYYVAYQPVTVNNAPILNAPKTNSLVESNSDELIIPDVNLTSKTNTNIGGYHSGNASSGGSTYGSMQTQSYQNTNAGSGSAGGGSFIASGGSRSSAGSSGIIMTNGIATLSTTTNLSNTTTRQSVNTDITSVGGTDPGGDPTGDPIPVGDGWGLLILFGIVYCVFKSKYIYTSLLKMDSK